MNTTNTKTTIYVRPAILASYTLDELAAEAAVCVTYGAADKPITGMSNDRPAGNGWLKSDNQYRNR